MSSPVWVVGGGSIGTFLAAKLSQTGETVLVTRNDPRPYNTTSGIRLTGTEEGSYFPAAVAITELKKPKTGSDPVLILATKAFDLALAVRSLRNVYAGSTPRAPIFLAQNGLGLIEEAQAEWPGAQFARMICWLGVRATEPGRVQVAGIDAIELGAEDFDPGSPADLMAERLRRAGLPVKRLGPPGEIEWRKASFNIALNALCALEDKPNGAVLKDPAISRRFRTLLDEAFAVALAEGVVLGEFDRERILKSVAVVAENHNSTVQDVRAGRRTELRWLNGALVERAKRLGVPVPENKAVYLAAVERFEKNTKRD